jgi:hypothetical protein
MSVKIVRLTTQIDKIYCWQSKLCE